MNEQILRREQRLAQQKETKIIEEKLLSEKYIEHNSIIEKLYEEKDNILNLLVKTNNKILYNQLLKCSYEFDKYKDFL